MRPPDHPPVWADLHTHTHCSDGALAPAELVAAAADRGVQVLAVTDHDTVRGLVEAEEAATQHGLRFVPGIEVSATVDREEVHILAYGIDPDTTVLRQYLRSMQEARRDRAWAMIDRLRAEGMDIDGDLLRDKIETTHAVGRPHVAAVLVQAGHVDSTRDAFDRYLDDDGPAYVPKPTFAAADALRVIHEAGGVGVLAHPGHWTPQHRIRRLVDEGLDGIEVWHPSHDPSLHGYYGRLARGYELWKTGGSDYHDRADGEKQGLGQVGMTEKAWERFRAALA